MSKKIRKRSSANKNNTNAIFPSYLRIPDFRVKKLNSLTLDNQKTVALLHEMSFQCDLTPVFKQSKTLVELIENSLEKFFKPTNMEKIQFFFNPTLTVYENITFNDIEIYNDEDKDNTLIMGIGFDSVDYENFNLAHITKTLTYEEGHSLLSLIDEKGVNLFATPQKVLAIHQDFALGGEDNEKSFIVNCLGIENRKEIKDELQAFPIKVKDFIRTYPQWVFEKIPRNKKLFPELETLSPPALQYNLFCNINFPAIILWENKKEHSSKLLSEIEYELMESENDIFIGQTFWPLPLNNHEKMQMILSEIKKYLQYIHDFAAETHRIINSFCCR